MAKLRKYFIVEGDHPVLKRVYGHISEKEKVLSLLSDMIDADYENIKVTGKEEFVDG